MITEKTVTIETETGKKLDVKLYLEGNRLGTYLRINGIPHHFEMMQADDIVENYKLDTDPDYVPCSDELGHCYVLVPFSQ